MVVGLDINLMVRNTHLYSTYTPLYHFEIDRITRNFLFQEHLVVELGLQEARLESSKRKLEADLRADCERQITTKLQEAHDRQVWRGRGMCLGIREDMSGREKEGDHSFSSELFSFHNLIINILML